MTLETSFSGPDGPVVDLEVTCVATKHDNLPGRLIVGRDLADRKRIQAERSQLEEQMRDTQRLESLGVLAGGIAHDFNNLLVGILGNASLALMDIPADDPMRDGIAQIEAAAHRAAELTEQILTFAGQRSTAMEQVNLSELASEMGRLLTPAISNKAQVSYELPPSVPPILGDAGQIRQVVMNLIMNASDALDGKSGSISMTTGETMMGTQELRRAHLGDVCTPGRYIYVEVIDEGCGMSLSTRSRMFDPFFTTKTSGRGLGLAAALGIIRSHGGAVEVESFPGEGTRFRILFPAYEGTPEKASPPSDPENAWNGGGTILIMDDDPVVSNVAKTVLRRNGFEVLEASGGRAGLNLLRSRPDLDLAIVDLTMPDLDGTEVLAKIRKSEKTLPVLLISGYSSDAVPPVVLMEEDTEFLGKPYSPADLLNGVSRLLQGSRHRRGHRQPA